MSAPAPRTVKIPSTCVALPATPTFPMSVDVQGAGSDGVDVVSSFSTMRVGASPVAVPPPGAKMKDPTAAPPVPCRGVIIGGPSVQVFVAGSYSSVLAMVPQVEGAPSPPKT